MVFPESTVPYERLQTAVDASGVGTWDFDPTTGDLQWSDRCRELFGATPTEEITYEVFLRGIHAEDQALANGAVQRALDPAGNGTYDIEFRTIGLHADQPQRWVRATGRAFFDEPRARALRFIGTISDVTERQQLQEHLRQREADFTTMVDAIAQLAWMAEPDGHIFWYNQRWYDYTGTTLPEMQGWGWTQVHHPDHVDRVTEFVKAAWATHEPWELSFPLRSGSGEYRWFLTRAVPALDEYGQVARWFGTNTDVTQMRQLQEQLERSYQDLEEKVTFRNIKL